MCYFKHVMLYFKKGLHSSTGCMYIHWPQQVCVVKMVDKTLVHHQPVHHILSHDVANKRRRRPDKLVPQAFSKQQYLIAWVESRGSMWRSSLCTYPWHCSQNTTTTRTTRETTLCLPINNHFIYWHRGGQNVSAERLAVGCSVADGLQTRCPGLSLRCSTSRAWLAEDAAVINPLRSGISRLCQPNKSYFKSNFFLRRRHVTKKIFARVSSPPSGPFDPQFFALPGWTTTVKAKEKQLTLGAVAQSRQTAGPSRRARWCVSCLGFPAEKRGNGWEGTWRLRGQVNDRLTFYTWNNNTLCHKVKTSINLLIYASVRSLAVCSCWPFKCVICS